MKTPDDTLVKLQQELAALLDPQDYPGDWTLRQRDTYEGTRAELRRRIMAIQNTVSILADIDAQAAPITANTELLALLRKPFCDELLALPPRDSRATTLGACIRAIDFGVEWSSGAAVIPGPLREKLMAAFVPTWAGGVDPWRYLFGDLRTCEKRLKELKAQRTAAQAALDAALLSDDARAKKAKDDAEWQGVLNTMKIKGDSFGNGTVVAYDKKTGEEMTTFTPAQLKALRRLNETQPVSNLPTPSEDKTVAITGVGATGDVGTVTTEGSTA